MKWKHPATKLFSLKNVSRIASWNVRTIYETGKAAQAAREMERYKLDILGLSEVRWTSSGAVVLSSGQTLLFFGPQNENDNHQHGVGILLNKKAKSSLMEWNPISERIIMARYMSKVQIVTVIQCYAPTNVAKEEDKEEFYNQLQATIDKTTPRDVLIVMGDMNAKVGQDNTRRELIIRKEGIGDINENGKPFADFCCHNDLVIGGTTFPHKDIHKTTWKLPDMRTRNQIDHIKVARTWRKSMQDVRVYRGADIESDYQLLVAKFKIKIARATKQEQTRNRKFNIQKLNNPELNREFSIKTE